MADDEALDLEGEGADRTRVPHGVYDHGSEPDALFTLANERTYLAWLRLAVTLLASAVAIDRLFLDHPSPGSEILALGLVGTAFGACALGVRRWWVTELALRVRRPLPGFGAPMLSALAIALVGGGVLLLVLVPRA